jgi:hypothetical protein
LAEFIEGWHQAWNSYSSTIQTAVVLAIMYLLFSGKLWQFLKSLYRRVKRIDKNGVEFHDVNEKVDPNSSCPYTRSKERSMEAVEKNAKNIAENTKSIESLDSTSKEIMKELKFLIKEVGDFRLDQLKDAFWRGFPEKESLISGLKFVSKGGNSDTKIALIERAKEKYDLYETAVLVQPNWKLAEVEEWIKAKDRPDLRLEGVKV